jgi:hypothetical protein
MTLSTWLILIAIAGVILSLYFRHQHARYVSDSIARENDLFRQHQDEVQQLTLASYKRSVDAAIYQSLSQMDKTCDFFTDEDEASRELTTCLNLLGHNAIYHYAIRSGRTVDIFLDNIIIEAKLNPKQSDIDRLIGQVGDYLTFPYAIYIVLYGQTDPAFIARIQSQIVDPHPDRVSLVYLPDAQRTKRDTEASRVVFAKG